MTYRIARSTYIWSFIFAGAFLAVSLVRSPIAWADGSDSWNDGTGNWSNAADWTNGSSGHTVPIEADTVSIINADSNNRTRYPLVIRPMKKSVNFG